MTGEAIHRLTEAIRYPDTVPDGESSFIVRVDGMAITAQELGGKLLLKYILTDDEYLFRRLAEYAAGRLLKEEATLSAESPSGGAFLWQGVDAHASAHELLRLFETFTDSCDWWRERVESIRGDAQQFGPSEMVMRP